jgi:S-formylglutathione hydrolase
MAFTMRAFLLVLFAATSIADESLVGTWKGTIVAGDTTTMTVAISERDGTLAATFDAVVDGKPLRGTFAMVRREGNHVRWETRNAASVCDMELRGNRLTGSYRNNRGSTGTCDFTKAGATSGADRKAGTVREIVVHAPSLQGNLLGDPTEQKVAVYLPPSYSTDPSRRFPVLYLLHGIGGSYGDWTRAWNLPGTMDRLIAAGRIQEIVVVMPNGANRYGGGFYANSPVTGRWEDFITQDLVGYVDREFRTIARSQSRMIAGHSMGGFGALNAVMRHPDLFAGVYAMSPCCLAMSEDISYGNRAWDTTLSFDSPDDLQESLQKGDFYPVAIIALSAVMSPAPDRPPFYVEFPVKRVRGELMPTALYDTWAEKFPVRQIAQYRDALRGLRAIHLDYGIDDQFAHIPAATTEFSSVLSRYRIPHTLDVYEGDHRALIARRLETVVLPAISAALSR